MDHPIIENRKLEEDAKDVVEFFKTELNYKHTDEIKTIFKYDKDGYILVSLTGDIVDSYMACSTNNDIDVKMFLFSVNKICSLNGIGMTKEDKVCLILMDEDGKNFFVIDCPKTWSKENRINEAWRLHIVENEREIVEVRQLETWEEFLFYYRSKKEPEFFDDLHFGVTI